MAINVKFLLFIFLNEASVFRSKCIDAFNFYFNSCEKKLQPILKCRLLKLSCFIYTYNISNEYLTSNELLNKRLKKIHVNDLSNTHRRRQ